MNAVIEFNAQPLTMSSNEIAALTEKRHGDVIRDIRTMIEVLGDDADLRHVQETNDSRGYTSEFSLPKDLTLTLVAGYNVKLRKRIIDRWLDLEEQATKPALNPANLSRLQLIEMAMQAEQERLALEHKVEVLTPKAEAFEMLEASSDTLTYTEAAKVIGVKRKDFVSRLHSEGWHFRQNKSWVAYDKFIKNGCLQYKEAKYTDESTGMDCVKPYCHITPKGLARAAMLFSNKTT